MVVMRANIDLNRCDVERHGIRCLRRAISNDPYGSGTPSSAARRCYMACAGDSIDLSLEDKELGHLSAPNTRAR
jgi:hypothetical protein